VPSEDVGTLSNFEDLDEDFVHVNQLLKFFKLGFARVTDEACQAIRMGTMDREKAIELVRKYDGKCADRYIRKFSEYIGISLEEFWRAANSYRNPDIWQQDSKGEWQLQSPIFLQTI